MFSTTHRVHTRKIYLESCRDHTNVDSWRYGRRTPKSVVALLAVSLLLAACGGPAAAPAPAANQPAAAAQPTAPVAKQPTEPIALTAAAPSAPVVAPAEEPTRLPEPTAAPTAMPANMGTASFNGISFDYDVSLAQQITTTTVPAQNPGADAPQWAIFPAYDEFNFVGYPSKNTYHRAHIEVYPVAEFEQMNPAAKDAIEKLKQLLAEMPASPSNIPLLPIFNAAQVFRTQVKYLNFQSGQGIRFVTQYDQAYLPINNLEVFYTFQGLTSNGQYYVTAILPVSTASLPDSDQVPQDQIQSFGDNFPQYLNETAQKINALQPSDFTPNLGLLDTLVQSLRLEK
jgi:hypothetical protein